MVPRTHDGGTTMSAPRYRVLGLAHPRSAWFRELSRWSTNAALPVGIVTQNALTAGGAVDSPMGSLEPPQNG